MVIEVRSSFLLIKSIEMGQLRCVRSIKAPVQHFGSYFCLGVYLLMLKTRIKITTNIDDRTIESMLYNNVLIFYYEQTKSFSSKKSITDVNRFITTKCFKYVSGNKN